MSAIKLLPDFDALLAAAVADDDLFAIWDTSQSSFKKITRAELVGTLNAAALTVVSGTSHDLADDDAGKILVFTSASAITLNVPTGLAAGFQCGIVQRGAGKVTVTAGGGVTLTSFGGMIKTAGAGATAALTRVAADDFVLGGTLGG